MAPGAFRKSRWSQSVCCVCQFASAQPPTGLESKQLGIKSYGMEVVLSKKYWTPGLGNVSTEHIHLGIRDSFSWTLHRGFPWRQCLSDSYGRCLPCSWIQLKLGQFSWVCPSCTSQSLCLSAMRSSGGCRRCRWGHFCQFHCSLDSRKTLLSLTQLMLIQSEAKSRSKLY